MPRKTAYAPTETTLAREWARENSIDVSERGRVSKEILKAYRNDMTRLNNGGAPQSVKRSTPIDPAALGVDLLSFQQITQFIQPETAKLLLSSAIKQPDPVKTQMHVDALERTVLGTYTPLDCLVVLDAEGRAFAGLELLAAGVRTNTAVRVILSSIGPRESIERERPTQKAHPDTDDGIDYAVQVVQAIEASHGRIEELITNALGRSGPSSENVKHRARALLEQGSIMCDPSRTRPHRSLNPVFIDALRLMLSESLDPQETECIDSSYSLFFQAIDRGLADKPILINMLGRIESQDATEEEAAKIVVETWLSLTPSKWTEIAHEVLKKNRIKTDPETLSGVLRLNSQGLTERAIAKELNLVRSTVNNWINAAEKVLKSN